MKGSYRGLLRFGKIAIIGLALGWGCTATHPGQGDAPYRVIDTHTHFWDLGRPIPPGRPTAVPFSNGRTVLPDEYVKSAKVAGISGTVVVEASGWVEDNEWVL